MVELARTMAESVPSSFEETSDRLEENGKRGMECAPFICIDRWLAVFHPNWYRTGFGVNAALIGLINQQLWYLLFNMGAFFGLA
ncbi:hypothetical protein BV898_18449 [Hypsibius exemplaris]|uniref:Uncharacterized protein n=1 Tax=Hypsibius exemplaris TaxID=2072580 RepID=A0A9X6NH82_HYPEX|nr:hypothetical protein BV898_18449 [Hypsibius exemplaris]